MELFRQLYISLFQFLLVTKIIPVQIKIKKNCKKKKGRKLITVYYLFYLLACLISTCGLLSGLVCMHSAAIIILEKFVCVRINFNSSPIWKNLLAMWCNSAKTHTWIMPPLRHPSGINILVKEKLFLKKGDKVLLLQIFTQGHCHKFNFILIGPHTIAKSHWYSVYYNKKGTIIHRVHWQFIRKTIAEDINS